MLLHILSKILNNIKLKQDVIFLSIFMLLISYIGYNLGQINALGKTPIKVTESTAGKLETTADIYQAADNLRQTIDDIEKKLDTRVVVSKNSSSKKYHYSWCPSAKKIKSENQIWFSSAEEAETKGYSLAGNCNR